MRSATDLLDELNAVDESARIEAKRASDMGKSVMETVIAFANEPGLDGGTPAPAAKADQVAPLVVPVTDHDGLQHAALDDVLRQLLDGLWWKFLARVVRVFVQLFDGHHQRQAGRHELALEQVQLVEVDARGLAIGKEVGK